MNQEQQDAFDEWAKDNLLGNGSLRGAAMLGWEEGVRRAHGEDVAKTSQSAAEKIGIYLHSRLPMSLMPCEFAGIAAIIKREIEEGSGV